MTDARTRGSRRVVVTGANSGIGLELTRALVRRGDHVVLAVRDIDRGRQAAARLEGPGATRVIRLDLADLDSVTAFARTLLNSGDDLAALVCNAGMMGGPLQLSAQGCELQMATNHLGHAALTSALWPLLDAGGARVALVSSGEARHGQLSEQTTAQQLRHPDSYDGKQAYRDSKQANLLYAQELHRRCARAGSPVSVVAVHPGAVATNLFARQLHRTGRPGLARASSAATSVLLPAAAAGARSILMALDPDTTSGTFIAPSGRAQLRGRPQPTQVYRSCHNPATAERLWHLTEQVLHKRLPPLLPAPA